MTARSRPRARAKPVRTAAWTLHGAPEPAPATDPLLDRLALILLAAVAALLTYLALGPHRVGDYFTETDFYGAYAEGARLVQHGTLDPSRYGVIGPFYEIVLGLVGFAIHDLFLAAELLSVVSVVAGLFLWHRLLARRAGPRLAVAALVVMAANAFVLRYGFSAATDGLAFALQAAALYLLLAAEGPRAPLLAGLVGALAFLTRYTAIYLLPAGMIALLAGGTSHPDRRRAATLFALGFFAPVVPWVLWSLAHGGRLTLQLHHNIAYDVFARSRGIPWDTYQEKMQPEFKNLWVVIGRDPGAVMRRELFNVWDHLRLDARNLLGVPTAACAAIGAVLAARDGTLRKLWPIVAAGVLLFLALVPSFYSERYSLPLLPVYAALAGAAFASPLFAIAIMRGRLWLKLLVFVVPLGFAVLACRRELVRMLEQLPVEVLEAARVLREQARPGDRVMARKPHVAFHAGLKAQAFPFASSLAGIAEVARQTGTRWLFFSWPEAQMRPLYGYLLDTAAVVPGLTVRYSAERPAVLYEIGPDFGRDPDWLANDTTRSYHIARGRLRVNPADRRMLLTLGAVEGARGRPDLALPWLERAAVVAPNDFEILMALAQVNLALQRVDQAAGIYARAEAIQPGTPAVRVGLGWVSLLRQQPREAAELWRPVVARTRDPATLQRMIELYRAVGDPAAEAEARAALTRASER